MSTRMCCLSLLIVISILASSCHGQMTIPVGDLGFVYRGTASVPRPQVRVAAYLDLSCPDSQASYPTLLKVADYFRKQMELKIYLFPLPYHRNSHVLSKGANVLNQYFMANQSSTHSKSVYDWFTIVYKNMDELIPSATAKMNDYQVLDIVTSLAMDISSISKDAFQAGVANRSIDLRTRTEWKYGCTRGVYGTPMFTVNDVFVDAGSTWTVDQWIKLIKTVLPSSSH